MRITIKINGFIKNKRETIISDRAVIDLTKTTQEQKMAILRSFYYNQCMKLSSYNLENKKFDSAVGALVIGLPNNTSIKTKRRITVVNMYNLQDMLNRIFQIADTGIITMLSPIKPVIIPGIIYQIGNDTTVEYSHGTTWKISY